MEKREICDNCNGTGIEYYGCVLCITPRKYLFKPTPSPAELLNPSPATREYLMNYALESSKTIPDPDCRICHGEGKYKTMCVNCMGEGYKTRYYTDD